MGISRKASEFILLLESNQNSSVLKYPYDVNAWVRPQGYMMSQTGVLPVTSILAVLGYAIVYIGFQSQTRAQMCCTGWSTGWMEMNEFRTSRLRCDGHEALYSHLYIHQKGTHLNAYRA